MEKKNTIWIAVAVIAVIAAVAGIIVTLRKDSSKNYDTSSGKKGGFFESLFANAANGVDALGRNQTSTTAAFWNGIIGIIATKKGNGTAYFVPATYSDPGSNEVYKINYGPYIVGGIGLIVFSIVIISIFKK